MISALLQKHHPQISREWKNLSMENCRHFGNYRTDFAANQYGFLRITMYLITYQNSNSTWSFSIDFLDENQYQNGKILKTTGRIFLKFNMILFRVLFDHSPTFHSHPLIPSQLINSFCHETYRKQNPTPPPAIKVKLITDFFLNQLSKQEIS